MEPAATSQARAARRARTAILHALSATPSLHDPYVLKGGLALQLAFGSPRTSEDVDLNAVEAVSPRITDETGTHFRDFVRRLDAALAGVRAAYAFRTLETRSSRLSREIPTLLTDVAFVAESGDDGVVELQLTLSEIICETVRRTVEGIPLHLASLDDILAEKLKALLQQITRDKVRSSDVFDIWYFSEVSPLPVDPDVVSDCLIRKSRQWRDMPPLAKSQFRRKSVVAHAAANYAALPAQLPESFAVPAFRDVYACILRLVDLLALPEEA